MKQQDIKFFERMLLLVLILGLSLGYLYLTKSMAYTRYERIEFYSAGAKLYANLYYPSKSLSFQEKRPLIIYCHGIGTHRDIDLRIPIEFTKRGFYVAALDYQGHGESGGNIINIDPKTNIPALAEDCSNLLDKLETLPFYSNVNTSQIGLIGHSLGGMVVLMNQALDPRFNITVAWAPLVNFDPVELGIIQAEKYKKYIPVNLLNTSNTHNLLIIMNVNDEALNFTNQALKAQELTNCTVIPITYPTFGGNHQLYSDEVIIKSINWFEYYFFGSTTKNGPIKITYLLNYITIFISMGLLFIIVLKLISYAARAFNIKDEEEILFLLSIQKKKFSKSYKLKQFMKLGFFLTIFILNWDIFNHLFKIFGIILASILNSIIFGFIALKIHHRKLKIRKKKFNLKHIIESQVRMKHILFAILSSLYFMGNYLIFTFYYPFAFMWPSNFLVTFPIGMVIFPIYFSMEILYRKVLYPQLNFIKSEKARTRVIIIIAIIVQLYLVYLTRSWAFFHSVICTYIILLVVIIQNTLIYANTKCFTTVIVSSFIILQLFFSAVISNAFGIGAVLHYFIDL